MPIRIKIERGRGLEARLRRVSRDLERTLSQALLEAGEEVRAEARALLDEPGGGRPSAPGEPPRRDTGRLRDSVFVRPAARGPGAEVGCGLDYGAHLEFGTRRMAARPWLAPALEAARPRVRARLARAVQEVLRKAR